MNIEEFKRQLHLDLPEFEVNLGTEKAIEIDKHMPIYDRPNKRSRGIIFEFSDEFCEDIILDNFDMMQTKDNVEKYIHDKVSNFEFESNHERSECQPIKKFTIGSNFIVYR